MNRATHPFTLLAVTLALVLGSRGECQAPSSLEDSIVARLLRLDSTYRALDEARERGRDSLVASALTDSVIVGALRVRTSAALAPLVHRAASEAWAALGGRLDATARLRLEAGDYLVQAGDYPVVEVPSGRPLRGNPSLNVLRRNDRRRAGDSPIGFRTRSADALGQLFRREIMREAAYGTAPAVGSWLDEGALPLDVPTRDNLHEAQVELGAARSRRVRSCLAGDDGACRRVMMLDSMPDAPWRSLYDDDEIVAYVAKGARRLDGRPLPDALQQRCLAGDRVACDEAIRWLGPAFRLPPLVAARQTLLAEALLAGNTNALTALRDSTTTMAERLTRASALPLDTLFDRWRTRIETAPQSPSVPIGGALATLAWAAFAGALLLVRRTRCA